MLNTHLNESGCDSVIHNSTPPVFGRTNRAFELLCASKRQDLRPQTCSVQNGKPRQFCTNESWMTPQNRRRLKDFVPDETRKSMDGRNSTSGSVICKARRSHSSVSPRDAKTRSCATISGFRGTAKQMQLRGTNAATPTKEKNCVPIDHVNSTTDLQLLEDPSIDRVALNGKMRTETKIGDHSDLQNQVHHPNSDSSHSDENISALIDGHNISDSGKSMGEPKELTAKPVSLHASKKRQQQLGSKDVTGTVPDSLLKSFAKRSRSLRRPSLTCSTIRNSKMRSECFTDTLDLESTNQQNNKDSVRKFLCRIRDRSREAVVEALGLSRSNSREREQGDRKADTHFANVRSRKCLSSPLANSTNYPGEETAAVMPNIHSQEVIQKSPLQKCSKSDCGEPDAFDGEISQATPKNDECISVDKQFGKMQNFLNDIVDRMNMMTEILSEQQNMLRRVTEVFETQSFYSYRETTTKCRGNAQPDCDCVDVDTKAKGLERKPFDEPNHRPPSPYAEEMVHCSSSEDCTLVTEQYSKSSSCQVRQASPLGVTVLRNNSTVDVDGLIWDESIKAAKESSGHQEMTNLVDELINLPAVLDQSAHSLSSSHVQTVMSSDELLKGKLDTTGNCGDLTVGHNLADYYRITYSSKHEAKQMVSTTESICNSYSQATRLARRNEFKEASVQSSNIPQPGLSMRRLEAHERVPGKAGLKLHPRIARSPEVKVSHSPIGGKEFQASYYAHRYGKADHHLAAYGDNTVSLRNTCRSSTLATCQSDKASASRNLTHRIGRGMSVSTGSSTTRPNDYAVSKRTLSSSSLLIGPNARTIHSAERTGMKKQQETRQPSSMGCNNNSIAGNSKEITEVQVKANTGEFHFVSAQFNTRSKSPIFDQRKSVVRTEFSSNGLSQLSEEQNLCKEMAKLTTEVNKGCEFIEGENDRLPTSPDTAVMKSTMEEFRKRKICEKEESFQKNLKIVMEMTEEAVAQRRIWANRMKSTELTVDNGFNSSALEKKAPKTTISKNDRVTGNNGIFTKTQNMPESSEQKQKRLNDNIINDIKETDTTCSHQDVGVSTSPLGEVLGYTANQSASFHSALPLFYPPLIPHYQSYCPTWIPVQPLRWDACQTFIAGQPVIFPLLDAKETAKGALPSPYNCTNFNLCNDPTVEYTNHLSPTMYRDIRAGECECSSQSTDTLDSTGSSSGLSTCSSCETGTGDSSASSTEDEQLVYQSTTTPNYNCSTEQLVSSHCGSSSHRGYKSLKADKRLDDCLHIHPRRCKRNNMRMRQYRRVRFAIKQQKRYCSEAK